MKVKDETIIMDGKHRHQYGVIGQIDDHTVLPFASVQLRGAKGQLLATKWVLVPLKYCQPLDDEARALLKRVKAEAKAARKAQRAADLAAHQAFVARFVASTSAYLAATA
jgi:hypothetical protein